MLDGITLMVTRDESFRIFSEYAKKIFDLNQDVGPCSYCEEMVSHRQVGDQDIALELSSDPKVYHKECCPCQTDEKSMKSKYQDLDVKVGPFPGVYVGSLQRCPFCFRVFDSDGTEVQI